MYKKICCPLWMSLTVIFSALAMMLLYVGSCRGSIVATADVESKRLPIIMYHSFVNDPSLQNDYSISPKVLENDLKYLTENGFTTVTTQDLLSYVSGGNLPEKIVMLTMDDGFYNNYSYALPLLEKYDCSAVLSPVASCAEEYSDNGVISNAYGYCTFEILEEMENSGHIEIANHSYNLHYTSPRLGIKQLAGESDEAYKQLLAEDISKAQQLFCSNDITEPLCFTYPYGVAGSNSLYVIKELGFKCTLTCVEKTNTIYRDKECLYELGRYLRVQNESSESLFERICY